MNPYQSLDERYFWSPAVAQKNMFDIERLWEPKFRIGPRAPVATFGSCFAQHIGRALKGRGFNWMDAEPAPAGLPADVAKSFGFGVFSARTGNIYTASLLAQWVGWALGDSAPPDEVWEKDGRFYDPFRPVIEPGGFASVQEMLAGREMAIEAFRRCITEARVFVFTLGLTESWFNREGGHEYPMCPGTAAGEFDADRHVFRNQDYVFIRRKLVEAIRRMRQANPRLSVLLTVSPVPLTATMSGNHVLLATTESKSVLRAVAGSVSRALPFVDYFPSFEIISSTPYRGSFFEPNQRGVNPAGVAHVMDMFFACLMAKYPLPVAAGKKPGKAKGDVACEEALLAAFGTNAGG